jgi:hypothetical protein
MRASIPRSWSWSCSLPRLTGSAARLALAIERVAEALLVEEVESNPGHPEVIVRARELVRP